MPGIDAGQGGTLSSAAGTQFFESPQTGAAAEAEQE
jgi:hypothetical protein